MNLLLDALAWLTRRSTLVWNVGNPNAYGAACGDHAYGSAVCVVRGHSTRHSYRPFQAGIRHCCWFNRCGPCHPTLGLLTLFGLAFGIGVKAPLLALIVLAIPSLLAGTYAGIQAVDSVTVDAAQAIGMSTGQVIRGVELPLALPVIIGGIRAATLQVVSTTTLAAYTSDYGLGRYLFIGLKTRDYAVLLGGAILVIVLALLFEACLAAVQRAATRAVTHVK